MANLHLANPYLTGATALQKALAAAGLLTDDDVDDEFGPHTARACEIAKFRLGYPKAEIHAGHETADATLLAYLRGKKKLPPDYLERRRARLGGGSDDAIGSQTADEQSELARRAEVVSEFRWLIANEPKISYKQIRPIPVECARRKIPAKGLTTDCSGAVILACKWAGVPDPSGLGFSGAGFTGSFLSHLRPISRLMARPGDLVVFGPRTGEHVSMILARSGADFELGSHGTDRGPVSTLLSQQVKYHNPPTTFLALDLG